MNENPNMSHKLINWLLYGNKEGVVKRGKPEKQPTLQEILNKDYKHERNK